MMSDLGWHCTILKTRTSLILPLQGLKKLWNRDQRFHFFHVPLFLPPCCNYCRMRSFLSGFPSSFHMHTANQEMLLWCVISFPQQTTWSRENGYLTCWLKAIIENVGPARFYFPDRSCHVLSDLAAMRSVWQSSAQMCTAHSNSRRKKRGGKDAWLRIPH